MKLLKRTREHMAAQAVRNLKLGDTIVAIKKQLAECVVSTYKVANYDELMGIHKTMSALNKKLPGSMMVSFPQPNRYVQLKIQGNYHYVHLTTGDIGWDDVRRVPSSDDDVRLFCDHYLPVDVGSPLFSIWEASINKIQELKAQQRDVYDTVMASTSSFTTVERLLKEWPEAAELLPKEEVKKQLPALNVADLNRLLKLPTPK